MGANIEGRLVDKAFTFVNGRVQKCGLFVWDFSRKFDSGMKVISFLQYFYYFSIIFLLFYYFSIILVFLQYFYSIFMCFYSVRGWGGGGGGGFMIGTLRYIWSFFSRVWSIFVFHDTVPNSSVQNSAKAISCSCGIKWQTVCPAWGKVEHIQSSSVPGQMHRNTSAAL